MIILYNPNLLGESGLGKSTLVNTLFNSQLYPLREDREPTHDVPKTVEIQSISGGKFDILRIDIIHK